MCPGDCQMMTRTRLVPLLALAAAAGLAMTPSARAGDVTWDNGANNLVWDTVSLNWGGLAWNSAAGDGAIFGAAGIGAISMPGPIGARSLNFTVGGYSIAGPGPLSLSNAGASTLAAGAINVDTIGNVATVNTPIISSVGMRKLGSGTLELSAMNSIGGTIPLAGYVSANVLVNSPGAATSGSLRLLN